MHATAVSLNARGGSSAFNPMDCPRAKKSARSKRKSGGNNNYNNPNAEILTRKLDCFHDGILPAPSKNNKNSLVAAIHSSSTSGFNLGYCSSGELGFKSDDFGGSDQLAGLYQKKTVNKGGRGLLSKAREGVSDGDDGKGYEGPRKLFNKKGNNERNFFRTGGNPVKNLVMENVTILKRGETIQNIVASRRSDEEENAHIIASSGAEYGHKGPNVPGSPRVPVRRDDDNQTDGVSVSVSVEKKSFQKYPPRVWGSHGKVQAQQAKAVSRVSQVCPVGSPDLKPVELNAVGGVDKEQFAMAGDGLLGWLGPDPSVVSKEVSSLARSVSLGSRSTDISSDYGDLSVKLGESGSSSSESEGNLNGSSESSIKSGGSLPSRPNILVFESPHELTDSSDLIWAGPAYANSPSPRCLPLPKFFMRHKVRPNNAGGTNDVRGGEGKKSVNSDSAIQESKTQFTAPVGRYNVNMNNQGGVDAFATWNLRRLLHLE